MSMPMPATIRIRDNSPAVLVKRSVLIPVKASAVINGVHVGIEHPLKKIAGQNAHRKTGTSRKPLGL